MEHRYGKFTVLAEGMEEIRVQAMLREANADLYHALLGLYASLLNPAEFTEQERQEIFEKAGAPPLQRRATADLKGTCHVHCHCQHNRPSETQAELVAIGGGLGNKHHAKGCSLHDDADNQRGPNNEP